MNAGGLYIFDNFNLNYLLDKDNICQLTMDIQTNAQGKQFREIQYSTIDNKGILASFDTYIEQVNGKKPKVSYAQQTLQTYSIKQIEEVLIQCGFKLIKKCTPDGGRFSDKKSERMFIVAKLI